MPNAGDEFIMELLTLVVEERQQPNDALRTLLYHHPELTSDDIQLALVEAALRLEEMYDEVCQDEWNDWQRVDYWKKISRTEESRRSGSALLLQMKSELYRASAILATDVIQLHLRGIEAVAGVDLVLLWEEIGSEYF